MSLPGLYCTEREKERQRGLLRFWEIAEDDWNEYPVPVSLQETWISAAVY